MTEHAKEPLMRGLTWAIVLFVDIDIGVSAVDKNKLTPVGN